MELKQICKRGKLWVSKLLIVPYGIETAKRGGMRQVWTILLIVPYGIETLHYYGEETLRLAFNCTLWN